MSDNNFIRFFVMLNDKEETKRADFSSSGYCKVEGFGSKVIFTFSIRNLPQVKDGYKVYVVMKDRMEPILLGKINSNNDGIIYQSIQNDITEIFGGKQGLSHMDAIYIFNNMKMIF